MEYSNIELIIFLLFYGFVGWAAEVVVTAVVYHKFSNRGFFNLPICPKYGIMADILIVVLPTVGEELSFQNVALQYMLTLVTVSVVDFITSDISHRLLHRRLHQYERGTLFGGELKGTTVAMLKSAIVLIVIKLIHPFVFLIVHLIPLLILRIVGFVLLGILIFDAFTVMYAGRKRKREKQKKIRKAKTQTAATVSSTSSASSPMASLEKQMEKQVEKAVKAQEEATLTVSQAVAEENLGNRLYKAVWKRLEQAYPDMEKQSEPEPGKYVFAKGLCLNKLIWIFIIWALVGDLFETVFVWATTGVWMSRTSVIYGTFSIVWGMGAVIISLVTQRLADREDRYVFLAGCVLWSVYEYSCSVLSEVLFGRTFWDYSDMMFNIGGRTNLLFCMFGGLLSVLWVKMLYPLISGLIERFPPAVGLITTWAVIILMIADLVLSGAVLSRYVNRLDGKEPQNVLE